jgi:hypothetical protein
MTQYKIIIAEDGMKSLKKTEDRIVWWLPFDPANTDYQNFKTAVLEQQPGSSVVEDGDSFSLNANLNDSILEDADGNVMTIDEAKAYVRTLP